MRALQEVICDNGMKLTLPRWPHLVIQSLQLIEEITGVPETFETPLLKGIKTQQAEITNVPRIILFLRWSPNVV